MPDPNEPPLIIDPRLGSLLVSMSGLDATPSAPPGTPLDFGPPAAEGEAGTLGPYRVVKELGRGAMGAVFLALDTRLDRKLALKVMLPEFAANAESRERFLREAKAAAKVSHDNVVTVYEADERDGMPYIAMQLLQGYPLDAFLARKGTPSLRHVARIAREAALGLAAAHRLGVVHRDIKPANLWLEAPNGRVKLLDFGLARPGTDTELTKSGAVVGTPAFMSPEQALGEKVDHRTDLFSLGSVLYWLCTGQLPFQGPSVVAVLMALGTEEPKPVHELNPRVPLPLVELIRRLLAKTPEGRPQTAAEVANRLHEILEQAEGLSSAPPVGVLPGGAAPGAQASGADPWATRALSAGSQRAGPATANPGEPQLLHSMRVVAITPAKPPAESPEEKEDQEKEGKTGATRTVISSGVVWEESQEEPRKKVRAKEAREDDEDEDEEDRRDRPRRKRAKGTAMRSGGSSVHLGLGAGARGRPKKSGNAAIFIGLGAVALVALAVTVTLLVVGGRPKATDSAQQGPGDRGVIPGNPWGEPPPRNAGPKGSNPAPTRSGPREIILGTNNDTLFRDEAPPGGLLVGFDVWYGTFIDYDVIDAIRPIYRTDGKDTLGEFHGRDTKRPLRVLAKPDYAVGGLNLKAGLGPDSFVVVFMKVKGARLDPDDSYQSEKYGGPGGGTHPMLGGDGTPVIGVIGCTDRNSKLSGFGLAFPKK